MKSIQRLLAISIVIILCGCQKEDTNKVICTAGCDSMSWGIIGESGSVTENMTCNRNYTGNSYIETCTGTRTYGSSGKSYSYTAVYNWPNCSISVTVTGKGSCAKTSGGSPLKSCNCDDRQDISMYAHLYSE
jgi:hypothetical protein